MQDFFNRKKKKKSHTAQSLRLTAYYGCGTWFGMDITTESSFISKML